MNLYQAHAATRDRPHQPKIIHNHIGIVEPLCAVSGLACLLATYRRSGPWGPCRRGTTDWVVGFEPSTPVTLPLMPSAPQVVTSRVMVYAQDFLMPAARALVLHIEALVEILPRSSRRCWTHFLHIQPLRWSNSQPSFSRGSSLSMVKWIPQSMQAATVVMLFWV